MRGVGPIFGSRKCTASTGIAVGTSTVVRYSEEVRYWEGPLSEVPLYIIVNDSVHETIGCYMMSDSNDQHILCIKHQSYIGLFKLAKNNHFCSIVV